MKSVVVILGLFAFCYAKDLPNEITPCYKNDPDLSECFETNANMAMSYIAKGDKSYGFPTLKPLNFWKEMSVNIPTEPQFHINLTDIIVLGLDNMTLRQTEVDLDAQTIKFMLVNPKIEWYCNYSAKVFHKGVSYEDQGDAALHFLDGNYYMQMKYELRTVDGEEYADITNFSADFVKYHIDFNIKELDNVILKSYWEKAKKYFVTDEVTQPCGYTVVKYIQAIFSRVPFRKIFI